jgi:hypothetical protein
MPYTLRFVNEDGSAVEGGELIFSMSGVLNDPWNPIAGSNWIYDAAPQNSTASGGFILDPFTGLQWPLRVERAEVVAKEGLPIAQELDWVTLSFAPEVQVPDDAWIDWDAAAQMPLTPADAAAAAEMVTSLTAKAVELAGAADFAAADVVTTTVTDLAAYYGGMVGVTMDLSGTQATMAGAAAELAGIEDAAAKAEFLATFAADTVGGLDTSYVYELGSRGYEPTANVKSTVYYPADLFDVVKWHDGSAFSVADVVMSFIMSFEPGKKASAIYDESQAGSIAASLDAFRGFRIISTDPLVIENYTTAYALDAENSVSSWWPTYAYGESPWHTLAVANRVEAAGEAAFSASKAEIIEKEWMSFISGPVLGLLSNQLNGAIAESYIPYAPTMSQYITADEAAARYDNLLRFYRNNGHFWVGSGPYILDQVFTIENSLVLRTNPDFPDASNRWTESFGVPKLATVEVDGPGRVAIGAEATFDVFVSFEEEPYLLDEIAKVGYLVFDANKALVEEGVATAVEDGYFTVTLSAETSAKLVAGANVLDVYVVSKLVAPPGLGQFQFVTE